jgi:predicted porin
LKKQLLCTSAIALGCAIAAPASAQEWNMDWGGFVNTHVGYADVSGTANVGQDFDGVNIFVNREIHFTPSVTLDNGLTFGVNVQLEADNSSAPSAYVDESFMTVSSDTMGQIIIGNENSAGYLAMGSVYTPGVSSMAINSMSISGFIPLTGSAGTSFRRAGMSSLTEVGGNNDTTRITYFTPSFNGFTVGVSYAPNGTINAANNGSFDRNVTALTDVFDIGAKYSQSFNGVDVGVAGRYGTGDSNVVGVSDPETWAVGATIGVAGFTFGGTYAENDNGGNNDTTTPALRGIGGSDSSGWSLGATYDIAGPWTVGLDTYQGESKSGPGAKKDKYEAYKLGASRSLGAGVSWDVYAIYANSKNRELGTSVGSDATIIATAINLSF